MLTGAGLTDLQDMMVSLSARWWRGCAVTGEAPGHSPERPDAQPTRASETEPNHARPPETPAGAIGFPEKDSGGGQGVSCTSGVIATPSPPARG
jgi:hypothetical protein